MPTATHKFGSPKGNFCRVYLKAPLGVGVKSVDILSFTNAKITLFVRNMLYGKR